MVNIYAGCIQSALRYSGVNLTELEKRLLHLWKNGEPCVENIMALCGCAKKLLLKVRLFSGDDRRETIFNIYFSISCRPKDVAD